MTLDSQQSGDIFGKNVRVAATIDEWATLGGEADDSRSTPKKLVIIFRPPPGVTVKPFLLVFKGEQLTQDNAYLSPENMDVFAEKRDAVKRQQHHRQVHEAKPNKASATQDVPKSKSKSKTKRSRLERLLDKLPTIGQSLGAILHHQETKILTDHQMEKPLSSGLSEASDQELSAAVVSDTSEDTPDEVQGDIPTDAPPSLSKEQEATPKQAPVNRTQLLDESSHESSQTQSTADPEIATVDNDSELQTADQVDSRETSLLMSSTIVVKNESSETLIEEVDQSSSARREMSISSEESEEPGITTSNVNPQVVDNPTDALQTVEDQAIDALTPAVPAPETPLVTPKVVDVSSPIKQRDYPQTDDPSETDPGETDPGETTISPEENAVSIDENVVSSPGPPTVDVGNTVSPSSTPTQEGNVGTLDPSETLKIPEDSLEDTAVSSLPAASSPSKQDRQPEEVSSKPFDQTPSSETEEQLVSQPSNQKSPHQGKNELKSFDPSEASAEISFLVVTNVKPSPDDLTGLQSEDIFLLPEESGQWPWPSDLLLSDDQSRSSETVRRPLDELAYGWYWDQLGRETNLILSQTSLPNIEESLDHLGSSEWAGEDCFDDRQNTDLCNLPNPEDSIGFNIDGL